MTATWHYGGWEEEGECQEVKCLLSRLQEGGTSFPGRAPLFQKGWIAPSLVHTELELV